MEAEEVVDLRRVSEALKPLHIVRHHIGDVWGDALAQKLESGRIMLIKTNFYNSGKQVDTGEVKPSQGNKAI
jgi:hypothetical protein